jgi:hypothetical protein
MNALTWIAEQKILEATLAGELDNLPGAGKPLQLEDGWNGRSTNRLAYKSLEEFRFPAGDPSSPERGGGLEVQVGGPSQILPRANGAFSNGDCS